MNSDLVVTIRIRGLWRITLLGWAIRLFHLRPAHVVVDTK